MQRGTGVRLKSYHVDVGVVDGFLSVLLSDKICVNLVMGKGTLPEDTLSDVGGIEGRV